MVDKVYKACTLGREKSIIENNFKIINILMNGENIEFDLKFNEEIMESMFSNLDDEWEGKFTDNSYYIDGDKLVIVKGKKGTIINKEALRKDIEQLVYDKIEGKDKKEIEVPTLTKVPDKIDIEKIQKEVCKEAKNASYDEKTQKLSIHSNGIQFGITIDEAKKILEEDKEEYIIPLKIIAPEITTDKLGEEAFPDILGSFSTRYDASNINRATNIELAAKAINRNSASSRRKIFI